MKKETKEKLIQIRITEHEKKQIEADAKKHLFDSVSAFLLFLYRKHGKKE
jgi:hypothetical protein